MQVIGAIEKGIRLSSLGLNPTIQDKEVLVHVPRYVLASNCMREVAAVIDCV